MMTQAGLVAYPRCQSKLQSEAKILPDSIWLHPYLGSNITTFISKFNCLCKVRVVEKGYKFDLVKSNNWTFILVAVK